MTLIDTGQETMTGGRVKRAKEYIGNDTFFLTYGDGLSNINMKNLYEFHRSKKKLMTLSAVQPAGRYGSLEISETDEVSSFMEKPQGDGSWINGGFVCKPEIIDYIDDDLTVLEQEPLVNLSKEGQLIAKNMKASGRAWIL